MPERVADPDRCRLHPRRVGQRVGNRYCGCSACTEILQLGALLIEFDDGEYYYAFCLNCINHALIECTRELMEPPH